MSFLHPFLEYMRLVASALHASLSSTSVPSSNSDSDHYYCEWVRWERDSHSHYQDVFFWGGFCSCIQHLSYKKFSSCSNKCFFAVWLLFSVWIPRMGLTPQLLIHIFLPFQTICHHIFIYLDSITFFIYFNLIYYLSKSMQLRYFFPNWLHSAIRTINNSNYDMLNICI